MKKLTAIVFLFVFSLTGLVKIATVIDYCINQNYYSTELCINKEVVELSCNGKCQLSENIQKTDDNSPVQVPLNLEVFSFGPAIILEIGSNETLYQGLDLFIGTSDVCNYYKSVDEDIPSPPPKRSIYS